MKEQKLKALRRKIISSTRKETWFYDKDKISKGIKGWLGTQPIMFVGSNPSCNKSDNSSYTKFFYNQLKKNGFANAHLTDLIKIRGTNKEADKLIDKTLKKQIKFFKEEIDIIKPKLIVLMGGRTQRKIKKLKQKHEELNFKHIYHYSSIRFPKKNKNKFIQQMKKVKKLYSQK